MSLDSPQPRSGSNDVRTRLLDAAAAEFLSPEYGILERVVLRRIAQTAGVPERTARRYFSSSELRGELVNHLLDIRPEVDIDHSDFDLFAAALIDPDTDLSETLMGIARFIFEANQSNELLRAQMALWPYASHNPDIRDRLIELYDYWAKGARDGLNNMFVHYSAQFRFRPDWISVDEFARAMSGFLDGLAQQQVLYDLRAKEDPSYGAGPLHPDLAAKVMIAVFVSMIDVPGVPTIDEVLELVDGRNTSDATT